MNPSLLFLLAACRRGWRLLVSGLLIVTTPLVEKNPAKTLVSHAPVVLSMARVVVLGFAVAMLRQVWLAGIAGWPDATVSISVVLALPIVGALERVAPSDVVSLAQSLVGRFGTGDVRRAWSAYAAAATEPSKFDDHRSDATGFAVPSDEPPKSAG
jgi:hypothetical protein